MCFVVFKSYKNPYCLYADSIVYFTCHVVDFEENVQSLVNYGAKVKYGIAYMCACFCKQFSAFIISVTEWLWNVDNRVVETVAECHLTFQF